ncbi:hypothetical protein TEA_018402 [Camellia sinensis var. sinensis]|uniref:Oligopeptide transporter 7 n=1 Tax=Camellia sinensis var. sinensis TaxID=542762 RepID=A0A4S4CWP1_CAMSN|nr:hypothetical protein TEA_018402 [Camellia sinensis var. sinensis]
MYPQKTRGATRVGSVGLGGCPNPAQVLSHPSGAPSRCCVAFVYVAPDCSLPVRHPPPPLGFSILVTGAAGFVGTHSFLALPERGDGVLGFDNFSSYCDPSLKRARHELLSPHDAQYTQKPSTLWPFVCVFQAYQASFVHRLKTQFVFFFWSNVYKWILFLLLLRLRVPPAVRSPRTGNKIDKPGVGAIERKPNRVRILIRYSPDATTATNGSPSKPFPTSPPWSVTSARTALSSVLCSFSLRSFSFFEITENTKQSLLLWALHEKEERHKGGLTRNQFFLIAFICSFAYYVIPGYLFPMSTAFSWLCLLFPNSVLAHQLGSGLRGLGIGAFGLDWSSISAYLGSPLASPWFATANIAVGFVFFMYVLTPIAYWCNLFSAKTFPIFSDGLFTSTGQDYNITAIIDPNFHVDMEGYEREGYRELWQQSKSAFQEKKMDVHTKLMRKYKQVPEWWFSCILLMNIASTIFICEYYNDQLQLKWWGVLLACGLALFFTLPIGVITATTNQFEARNHLLEDFKLGHYMKIPPRTMFMAQVVGTLVSALVHLGTAWWLIETIPDICDRALLPPGSPWTCPSDHVFYDASVIWGLIGPRRIFGDLGYYSAINWFFLVGAIAPLLVWLAHKAFPNQQCIRLVTMPVLLHAVASMPPATAVNYTSWIIIGFFSGFVAYRYYRSWWSCHNYILSGALDAGLAFMAVLLYLCLEMQNIDLNWWGSGSSDGCPLASCPTAEGVVIKGCPGYLSEM